jgi:hypothetical protein
MERHPYLIRHAFVAALTMACASCNSDPARLAQLSGEPAKRLAAFEPAAPVLVAGADESVVAVVFSEDETDFPRLLEMLLVPEVEGCGRGGWFGREGWVGRAGPTQCCDRETGTFVLNSSRGWLRTGESCAPVNADERTTADEEDPSRTYDDPEGLGIEFVQVDPELSQLLEKRFGINYDFMQLAQADGSARALVNRQLPSPPPLALPMMQGGSGGQRGSEVILAKHIRPRPQGGCTSDDINRCSLGGKAFCRKPHKHVYYQDESNGDWCEFKPTCGC